VCVRLLVCVAVSLLVYPPLHIPHVRKPLLLFPLSQICSKSRGNTFVLPHHAQLSSLFTKCSKTRQNTFVSRFSVTMTSKTTHSTRATLPFLRRRKEERVALSVSEQRDTEPGQGAAVGWRYAPLQPGSDQYRLSVPYSPWFCSKPQCMQLPQKRAAYPSTRVQRVR
jgi:hypothetical protein